MSSDQREFAASLRRVLPDCGALRALLDQSDTTTDRALWQQLAEIGVAGIALPTDWGGGGAGLAEQLLIAEAVGRAVAPAPVMAALVGQSLLARSSDAAAREIGARAAAGELLVGAALSASQPPGSQLAARPGSDAGADARGGLGDAPDAVLDGVLAQAMESADLDVLIVAASQRWWLVRADLVSAGGVGRLTREDSTTIDSSRPLTTITFTDVPAQQLCSLDDERVLALARLLLAAEATGAAQQALDLAERHALARQQFGQPIGRFQAIKHRLADLLIAVEGARSACAGAVLAARDGLPEPREAALAKIVAGDAGPAAVGSAIQVHGAIGTAWEHDLHLLLRRAKYCQLVLGSPGQHRDRLVGEVLGQALDQSRDQSGREGPRRGSPRRQAGVAELSLSDADRQFQSALRDWLDENWTSQARRQLREAGDRIGAARRWQAQLADAGWAGVHWPREFGGRAATLTQQVVYHGELAAAGVPPLIGNRGLSLTGPTIYVHGTDDQRRRFVEATRRADILWASGLSEREAGSDLAALRTRAVVDGDELIVNGHKIWTSGAQHCDWIYLLVRTGALTPKHEGITALLAPLDSPGLTINPIRRMTGSPDYNELVFDDMRVSLSNVVGELDQGWRVARTTLSYEHMTNFLGQQLRMASFVDRILARLAARELADGVIDHSLRRRAADCWIDAQILRLHGLRNLSDVSASGEPGAAGSILKLFGQETEQRIFELALDAEGVDGLCDRRAASGYLGTRASTIGGGTSEVHRNKIAEKVLGMPRDLWA